MVALIAALALTGRSPGLPELHFEPNGIVPCAPGRGDRRDQHRPGPDILPSHPAGAWSFDQSTRRRPERTRIASRDALHFMHVSKPTRTLDPSDYEGASFADFGLDPPAYLVSLGKTDDP